MVYINYQAVPKINIDDLLKTIRKRNEQYLVLERFTRSVDK